MSDTTNTRLSLTQALGLTALIDLLVGVVLSAVGVAQDMQILSIIGVILLISGGGMLSWVIMRRNKPETL